MEKTVTMSLKEFESYKDIEKKYLEAIELNKQIVDDKSYCIIVNVQNETAYRHENRNLLFFEFRKGQSFTIEEVLEPLTKYLERIEDTYPFLNPRRCRNEIEQLELEIPKKRNQLKELQTLVDNKWIHFETLRLKIPSFLRWFTKIE